MAAIRHLNNAPIAEAVIDFRVKLAPDFNIDKLALLEDELHSEYPNHKKIRIGHIEFGIEGGDPIVRPPEKGHLIGYRLETEDGENVAQFRVDGFTFSRLRPYTDWERVFTEAKNLWNLYVAKTSPEKITRIAVRYINHLGFPLPLTDFARYLTSGPVVPESLPQAVSSFLSRITIHDTELGIAANITQALGAAIEHAERAIIILDIDTYKNADFLSSDQKMWDTFGELRRMKNRIFFDFLTEDAVRLFE